MVDMIRDNVGGETSETLSDTRILRFVNQAYLEVSSKYGFPQLSTSTTITTTSGTAAYELSVANVLTIDNVVNDTDNMVIYPINERQYHEYTSGNASSITGSPVYYFISGVGSNDRYELTFYPTPDSTDTIYVYYGQEPDELVTSPTATSPVTPEPFDDVIIHKATARALRMLGDMDKSYKWAAATRDIEDAARRTMYNVSRYPVTPGSIVGQATR